MINRFDDAYAFLSNFYSAPVTFEGTTFPTVEHAFQAAKTLDKTERLKVLTMTPGQAKRFGRHVQLRSDWESIKVDIMTQLVRQKFSHEPLCSKLLATGSEELVEGNWWHDTFWGVCNGVGENHLGQILMQIRTELSAQN